MTRQQLKQFCVRKSSSNRRHKNVCNDKHRCHQVSARVSVFVLLFQRSGQCPYLVFSLSIKSSFKWSVLALKVLGNKRCKNNFWLFFRYTVNTPTKLKIIDAYLTYVFFTGVIQFAYCCLVGTFPFNAFLSGFISCVGSFILGVCLRLQVNPQNKSQFDGISPERAFADFIFAHIILHLVVMNFIG